MNVLIRSRIRPYPLNLAVVDISSLRELFEDMLRCESDVGSEDV
jgi:hypothetical protein